MVLLNSRRRCSLRTLILAVSLLSALITLLNLLYATYRVQRQMLIDIELQNHQAYAHKLAHSAQIFLQTTLQQLAYSARSLPEHLDDTDYLQQEAERLRLQFDSVLIVNAQARVLASVPSELGLTGQQLHTEGAKQALQERRPLVSSLFRSAVGNLIVFVSQPLFDAQGQYLGYVGGTFHLNKPNILSEMLSEHFQADGSYTYVVDRNRRLLVHPDTSLVGTQVNGNSLFDQPLDRHSGSSLLNNSGGMQMLAGYTQVDIANWTIVSQRPLEDTLKPLDTLMRNMLLKSLPIGLLGLLVIWWCSRLIAAPLQRLAQLASSMGNADTAEQMQNIRSHYQEASELKRALLQGIGLLHARIGQLHQDVHTDPLTGLANRRALEERLQLWERQQCPFAVITLDIDHFKRVNDNFGHDVGDQVLVRIAELMRSCSRQSDLPCRVGGEEFVILLPNGTAGSAEYVAERLRELVERCPLELVGHVTISLGVAYWPRHGATPQEVFKRADAALYRAKRGGRNRVEQARSQTGEETPA